ncbi:hypothetical protein L1O03_04885 [Corynebacterium uropygiale]|uniref:Uncharacterized protein n=1 Tax=Corynebacterium uropygiale TaxID=1775911 RepID=A0A9X1QQD8_9CORY|nr:hypothetical protein [Corynebacterium uropygiale]MCF4006512.1 hypothetical protein [Corynebacterium uropygiale]
MGDLFLNFGSSVLHLATNIASQNWVGVAVQAFKTITSGVDLSSALSSEDGSSAANAADGAEAATEGAN